MKNTNSRALWLPLVIFSMGAFACSTPTRNKIDQDVRAQAAPTSNAELTSEGLKVIQESPDLSAEQKQKLTEMMGQLTGELNTLRTEERSLKLLLVKNVVNPKSDPRETNNLKKRIAKIDKKITDRTLDSVDEARKIMGVPDMRHENLYRAMFLEKPAEVMTN